MEVKCRATIFNDGTIMWIPGFQWRTVCTVDLYHFPFDTQLCHVKFTSWQYGGNFVNFSTLGDIMLNVYEPNEQWELLNTSMWTDQLPVSERELPVLGFSLLIRRKPMYYMLNVLVPAFTISLVSVMVFLLPTEAGEKISLSITVLLSYVLLLIIVSDVTPKSGDSIPLISEYPVHLYLFFINIYLFIEVHKICIY